MSLLAYWIAAAIYVKAWPIAFDAYNAVCPSGERVFGTDNWELFQSALIYEAMIGVCLFALPVLLARSKTAVGANFAAAVLVLLFSIGLLHSATTPPYECVTMGGSYEDHSSGIPEFEIASILSLLLLYAIAVIDLVVWLGRLSWPTLKRVIGSASGRAEPPTATPSTGA